MNNIKAFLITDSSMNSIFKGMGWCTKNSPLAYTIGPIGLRYGKNQENNERTIQVTFFAT